MTTRTVIGDNFPGAVGYQYTGRLNAPTEKQPMILFAAGVRTDNAQVMAADFAWGCTLNPNVGKPVWHTSISFNPDDAAKLTNEKMLAVAQDFRREMGLLNTQCVIFRHFDREDNQHLHILVNRVADDGHTIPDGRNFYRSKLAVEKLCQVHGLTPADGQRPELQHPERIVGAHDKAGAEIRQAIAYGLQTASERTQLWQELQQKGITATESSRGVTFTKDGFTFAGSQVAKGYSLGGIDRQLAANQLTQAARREEARQETKQVLTQTRDSGLTRPEQFFYRLRAQPYELMHDPQTRALTHVRHLQSGQLFAYAEVQPGGPGAPPLAEQLATAVRAEQQQVAARQQLAAGRDWAQGRARVEHVATRVGEARQFFDREELAAHLKKQGVTLLPPPAAGQAQLFRLDATNQLFREREVLRGGTVAALLAGAEERRATRRQQAWTQTCRDVVQTLHAPARPLASTQDYRQQLEVRGYRFRQEPGQAVRIEHLASGERFDLREVQPGGPAAPALARQVRDVLAGQQQPTKDVEQVLAAKNFAAWAQFEARVQARGYQFVTGLDGKPCLLHEQSRQLTPLATLRPYGRDLAPQVQEVIAAQAATVVLGQVEVLASAERAAPQRAADVQARLEAAGAQVNVTARPAAGTGEGVVLTYTHAVRDAPLDALNQVLQAVQHSQHITVRERDQGFGQPPAAWPARRGEYALATVVADDAVALATIPGKSVRELVERTGATVREAPGASAGSIVLAVEYHTARTDVQALTRLFDQWQAAGPGVQLLETERARQARGGQAPEAAKTFQYER